MKLLSEFIDRSELSLLEARINKDIAEAESILKDMPLNEDGIDVMRDKLEAVVGNLTKGLAHVTKVRNATKDAVHNGRMDKANAIARRVKAIRNMQNAVDNSEDLISKFKGAVGRYLDKQDGNSASSKATQHRKDAQRSVRDTMDRALKNPNDPRNRYVEPERPESKPLSKSEDRERKQQNVKDRLDKALDDPTDPQNRLTGRGKRRPPGNVLVPKPGKDPSDAAFDKERRKMQRAAAKAAM